MEKAGSPQVQNLVIGVEGWGHGGGAGQGGRRDQLSRVPPPPMHTYFLLWGPTEPPCLGAHQLVKAALALLVENETANPMWPKTLAGVLAFQPCFPASHPPGRREKKAWRRCDRAGRWAEDDYTQCPYASELTRFLHGLTQVFINTSNARPLGQQLAAFTSRAAHFTDVMDVIFVTHLVERLTRMVGKQNDVRTETFTAGNMILTSQHLKDLSKDNLIRYSCFVV
nr:adhesion G protein-coupled receptor A3-like [Nothobranchius furzeri]